MLYYVYCIANVFVRNLAKLTINSWGYNFFLCGLMMVFWGCTSPEVRFSQQAKNYGFEEKIFQGSPFKHVVFINKNISNDGVLHIYLDGDGLTWIHQRWISSNPTPRNTLMIRLMKQEKETSVYLGRPCYHGFSQVLPCTEKLWTSHRYSPAVVHSMAAVLSTIVNQFKPRTIVLIGYSGGGALAVLLAERFPDISAVITIAANLDIDAWTDYHGYSRLSGSLNPVKRKPLQSRVFQLHLAGGKDKNIPVSQIRSFTERQFSAQLQVYDNYDHHCCWEEKWASILESVDSLL